jgi:hypothetical protein
MFSPLLRRPGPRADGDPLPARVARGQAIVVDSRALSSVDLFPGVSADRSIDGGCGRWSVRRRSAVGGQRPAASGSGVLGLQFGLQLLEELMPEAVNLAVPSASSTPTTSS